MKSHPLFEKARIFAPGPTPVPEEVLSAMAKAPLHHRTKEFATTLKRVWENLAFLHQTKQPAYVLAASGTGAMEATITNCLSTGDEVVVVNGGKFGERWTKISEKFGLKVHEIKVEWGNAVDPDEVKRVLAANPKSVEEFRAGKEKAFNALVGQVMKASKGKANPQQVNEMLRKKLS